MKRSNRIAHLSPENLWKLEIWCCCSLEFKLKVQVTWLKGRLAEVGNKPQQAKGVSLGLQVPVLAGESETGITLTERSFLALFYF